MISPPLDALTMVVAEPGTTIVTTVSAFIIIMELVWSLRILRREGDPLPLLLGVGGLFGSLTEPFYDVVAAVWHPIIGQWTAFTLFDRATPVYICLGWCWNVGFGSSILYRLMVTQRIRWNNFWLWVVVAVGINVIFEVPGTRRGILGEYIYYGRQPFPLTAGSYPLPGAIANGICILAIAVTAFKLREFFARGWHAWILGWFITPFAYWAALGPGGVPLMMAIQSTNLPQWGISALGVVSILLSLGLAHLLRDLLRERQRVTAT